MDGKRHLRGLMTLLTSAVCEWLLMFFLIVDAALSYFLTKFAEHYELKPPCVLCSRLEHCFGARKPGHYWNLLCSSHREEISTLVSCSIHGKFANAADGLCEECLGLNITHGKSSSESYRLFVGKAWMDVDKSILQNLTVNKNEHLGDPDRRICSCCGKSWKAKANVDRLLKLNSFTNVSAKANIKPPQPRVPGRSRFGRKGSLKRLRDKASNKSAASGSRNVDALPRFKRGKRKISSQSDTEVLLSDDEGEGEGESEGEGEGEGRKRHCETYSEPEYDDAYDDRNGLRNRTVDIAVLERPMKKSFMEKPLSPEQPNLVDASDFQIIRPASPPPIIENSQKDHNWEKSYSKPSPSLELSFPDDGNCLSDIAGGSFGASADSLESSAADLQMPPFSGISEFNSSLPSSNATTILPKTNVDEVHEAETVHREAADNMHHTDTFPESVEPTELRNKHRYSNDWSDSSSDEPMEGTMDDDGGEDTVEKLKRLLGIERKYIACLTQELEEERNASGIAANQAMAMITRLQEEKAALHMEALQYLRMMEEQAEYDMEALAKANDQLAEREKEMQDMEYELDFYREYADDDGNPTGIPNNLKAARMNNGNGSLAANNTVSLSLVESKTYISQCLNTLEKKIHQLDDMQYKQNQENIRTEENGFTREIDPAKLLEEIVKLRERLEALETDCNFLRCASDLLRNENDGLQLLQEISHQLQEIRKIEFAKR